MQLTLPAGALHLLNLDRCRFCGAYTCACAACLAAQDGDTVCSRCEQRRRAYFAATQGAST